MPGRIQSIERAAAMLRLLAGAGRPLALGELAAALGLPRATAHGIVRTLREVGFVAQDRTTAQYLIGPELRTLGAEGWDRHDLRAHAMNWADVLAGSTGCAVCVGVPAGSTALLVHHVFRPDGSPQRLRTGEREPLHATALGKCLLAFVSVATPTHRELDLHPYTGRTCATVPALQAHLDVTRRRGYATDVGEYEPGAGGVAVALRGPGGLAVAALGIEGPVEHLFGAGGEPRQRLTAELIAAGREISLALREQA